MKDAKAANRYEQIIEHIFLSRYRKGDTRVTFGREEIEKAAKNLKIILPKNLGDLIYTFRFRTPIPAAISERAPSGLNWIIRLAGRGTYAFVATRLTVIVPRQDMAETKIPDATPGIIERYALSDEQALLAKLRYNRLIDIFTGVTCYSLQSHLRTTVAEIGQVETDEIYVGLDRLGVHYVLPVQAKGGRDKQSIVQIEQDFALCQEKFPSLVCRPVAAQFMRGDLIALLEIEVGGEEPAVLRERHYRLVPQEDVTASDLELYRTRSDPE